MSFGLPMRGEVRWALVPYTFEAPFRGTAWTGGLNFDGVVDAARANGRVGIEVIMKAKVRPVVILQSYESTSHGAYAVLRTRRLETMTAATQASVRAGDDPALHLLADAYAGSKRAVLLNGLTRIDSTAIERELIGRIDDAEMATISRGIAGLLELDLDQLVQERVTAVLIEQGLA